MTDPKNDESFRVVDRRLFTADGELRKEALEEEREREPERKAEPSKPAAAGPARGNLPATGAATEDAAPAPAANTISPSRGFQMLVDFLARNAALLLGGYPDPQTGRALLDLEGAREMIDMLDALREKTLGNLAPEDDRLLLDVLGSLKLSFMEVSKAAAQAVKEKAKARS